VILLLILSILFHHPEFTKNVRYVFASKDTKNKILTFNKFFDNQIFTGIKSYMDSLQAGKEYKIITIGIYPNIFQYYGIHTLDSYQNNYPLTYKHRFRKIIAGELDKSEDLKNYFDCWGSRCYAFTARTGRKYNYSRFDTLELQSLHYNWKHLKQMGGTFLISAVEIDTSRISNLKLLSRFNRPNSYWDLRIYEIRP